MPKGYVVSEVGYEYNDEIYYSNNEDSGVALSVYLNKEKAEKIAKEKNMQAIFNENIAEYGYEFDSIISDLNLFKTILNPYFVFDDLYELGEWWESNASGLPDSVKKDLEPLIRIVFFIVTTVDVET